MKKDKMNKLKIGIFLIILGNILYLLYIFFTGNETKWLLLGLSVWINLVGIILLVLSISKEGGEMYVNVLRI